jgi:predicted transposase/invertase (TIGR01784 family)
LKAKYINPYTDFGFKKLFGEEANTDLLIDFLNQLLPDEHRIVELSFKNPEKLSDMQTERRAIFDIHCENENGDKFIVEMQKAKIKFFKDRSIFYTTFPIKEQAEKGDWNFKLKPIYCVAILDFIFDEHREEKHYISNVQLKDQYCHVFYNKLRYIFIEMPRFNKQEDELKTRFDKWLYFLKNLEDFEEIPAILNEGVFVKGFETAEIANFDKKQMTEYEDSLKVYRDLKGVVDTSFEEGEKIGIEKGEKIGIEKGIETGKNKMAEEMAKKSIKEGLSIDLISKLTGLSREEIEKIKLLSKKEAF